MTRTSVSARHGGAAAMLIVLAFAAASCADAEPPTLTPGETASPVPTPTRTATAQLSTYASSLSELVGLSDLAIVASAGKSTTSYSEGGDPALPTTYQQFVASEVLWGSGGESVIVSMSGGLVMTGDGQQYVLQMEDQPPYRQGSTQLLLLMGPFEDDSYVVIGGSQGRFEVLPDGSLDSTVEKPESGSIEAQITDLSKDEAIKRLLELRGAPESPASETQR